MIRERIDRAKAKSDCAAGFKLNTGHAGTKAAVFFAVVIAVVFMVCASYSAPVKAAAAENSQKNYVTDDAGILSDSEENRLEKSCASVSKKCKTDIVILTLKTGLDGSRLDSYVRDFISEGGYGYDSSSSVPDVIVYVVDMNSRAVRVVTSGRAQTDISQSNLQGIVDKTKKRLTDGKYYKACDRYIELTRKELDKSISYRLFLYFPIKLAIAAAVAVISVLVMMRNAKSKMTVNGNTYAKDGARIHRREDRFINTTVTTRKIQTSSGSKGGGGGGRGNSGSAGGHF